MKLLLIIALIGLSLSVTEGVKKMVCYYETWAYYRPGKGKFDVDDLAPSICTHMIYTFAALNPNGNIKVYDPYFDLCKDYGLCGFDRFTGLKKTYPNVKYLLGVGGWNEGSKKYSQMAADPAKRSLFVNSSLALLKQHDFDGLDLDWEYPTQRGGSPDDYTNYVTLLKELKDALHPEGMMLSTAVSAGKDKIDAGYNVPEVSAIVDQLHLMTYDLHGSWEPYTHHQSLLYPYPEDKGDTLYLNVDWAVQYWLKKGAPKEKLVMGIPLYGRSWRLDSETDTGIYAPAHQPGHGGPYSEEPGYISYNEICESQMKHTAAWTIVHDPGLHEPYAYDLQDSNFWVSYEDVDSVALKSQYIMDNDLAGALVWAIDTDDFSNQCGQGKYPLLNKISDILNGGVVTWPTEPSTASPASPPSSEPTSEPPPVTSGSTFPPTRITTQPPHSTPTPGDHCKEAGPNADPEDCTHYYDCTQGLNGWEEYEEDCAEGTLFNPKALICDWKDSVCALGDVCPNDCP